MDVIQGKVLLVVAIIATGRVFVTVVIPRNGTVHKVTGSVELWIKTKLLRSLTLNDAVIPAIAIMVIVNISKRAFI
jgi:hypothetical protein